MIINILNLFRIKDWLKNLLIFIPLIFSNNLFQSQFYYQLIIAFLLFSLSSSFVYILNDIKDIEEDKAHPLKKNIKPLANGSFDIAFAKKSMILLFFLICFLLYLDSKIIFFILIYIILNILYSYYFKKIPIIDILLISTGYLIRVASGSEVVNVSTSYLTFCSIFFLSIFIISIKRKKELENKTNSRKSLINYNIYTLNIFIYISMLISFSSYLFYTLFINSILIITLPIVVLVFFRYLYITNYTTHGEFPIDVVMHDWKNLLLFIIFIVMVFYSFISY